MINLLSPQYKKELRKEENWKIILILEILFLIFLISLSLILFSIKIHLQSQLESQRTLLNLEEKIVKTPEFQPFFEKIISTNQNIQKLHSFYQKEILPSEVLEKVSEIILPSVHLTAFHWQKANSQIVLSGFSPTRDILFQLKKNLEEKKEFNEINFPPQNWIKSADIDFNVNFKYQK